MDSNVKVIYLATGFSFCSELHVRVDRVEVILYVIDVCVSGIINYQNVVYVVQVSCNLVLV